MKLCCDAMRSYLATAGEQGLGVVAVHGGDYRRFRMQARPFTPAQTRTFEALSKGAPGATPLAPLFVRPDGGVTGVAVLIILPLKYCPNCGFDFIELINRQTVEFDRLAASHGAIADR